MKQQFRNKKFSTNIKVSYTDALGNKNIWKANQSELIIKINYIISIYLEQNFKLTIRQLYYQLVSRDIIPNAQKVYGRICSLLTGLRYAGIVDWDVIEDRGRVPSKPSEWNNISDLIDSALYAYRLPRWSDQDYYIELYCEKQAMESILLSITEKYHIYFGVNKGYSSASTMYSIAKRIDKKIDENKKTIILYLGDHDASGLDMVRDIHTRICEFLRLVEDNDYFKVVPIALNMKQIKQYNPPPNPAKIKDPRAKWYIEKYGNKSWELDAIEPKILISLTENMILKYLNIEKYQNWISREKREAKKLKAFVESL